MSHLNTRPEGLHDFAKPVTEREWNPEPPKATEVDPRDIPITFGLSPREHDIAEQIREDLEAHRQRLNARQPHIERNSRKGSDL